MNLCPICNEQLDSSGKCSACGVDTVRQRLPYDPDAPFLVAPLLGYIDFDLNGISQKRKDITNEIIGNWEFVAMYTKQKLLPNKCKISDLVDRDRIRVLALESSFLYIKEKMEEKFSIETQWITFSPASEALLGESGE